MSFWTYLAGLIQDSPSGVVLLKPEAEFPSTLLGSASGKCTTTLKDFMDNNRTYKIELITAMQDEVFRIIALEEDDKGLDFANEIALTFLASFISNLVTMSLTSHEIDKTVPLTAEQRKKQYDKTVQSYLEMKGMIQEAVAGGFMGGWQTFDTVNQQEYICRIDPILEPVNPKPC